jgi:hypothetical protein
MNYFCTYCDQGYAARLLCLYESLRAQNESFRLLVLCFDVETANVVTAVKDPGFVAIPLDELLRSDPDYAAVRAKRTKVEFYFTATPVLVRYCLQLETGAAQMTYLDSDLYFFGPPSAVFSEQNGASAGIVAHRFPDSLAERLKYGTYNVAWVSFRRDCDGLACLEWWRERCLEWCHDFLDAGRFADQGYLDEFPRRFNNVRVIAHPGVNAAPWNMHEVRVSGVPHRVLVNEQPLLFYHFQGVREIAAGWFEPGLRAYQTPLGAPLRELIYLPYLQHLMASQKRLRVQHGMLPRFLHQRLNAGRSWSDRWERVKSRWMLPYYGRFQRRLLHASEP